MTGMLCNFHLSAVTDEIHVTLIPQCSSLGHPPARPACEMPPGYRIQLGVMDFFNCLLTPGVMGAIYIYICHIYSVVPAVRPQDSLQWPQAQGECPTLLPEVAGGASTEVGG